MARGELSTRLQALLGAAALVEAMPGRAPVVVPAGESGCALLLRTASLEGWHVWIEGAGSWIPRDAPADLVLSTRGLTRLTDVSAADLVATAETGIRWTDLRRGLADHGAWLAYDAPGVDRTLGSLLATGTAGPLRAGFGLLKDHVLGLSLVTGDGRVVRVGGRVMKNVAGYDVAKLAAGSFGAFGVVTAVHLRLRAVPRADVTLVGSGDRDGLLDAARAVLAAGLSPAALELISPRAAGAESWVLAARLVGTDTEVAADRAGVLEAVGIPLVEHAGGDAAEFWHGLLAGVLEPPVTVRLGAVPDGLEDALDLLAHHLDEPVADWISVTTPAGVVRWSGTASASHLARFRIAAAEHEWPVTVERAPWEIRSQVGHFGAYREGAARIVSGLRTAFDPAGVLVAPVNGAA
jgi:glycolate oxidase FAD binding subunit